MARKERSTNQLKRRTGFRSPRELILIVCEGEKTEPQYFDNIKRRLRLSNVEIKPNGKRTDPLSVVKYAETLFNNNPEYDAIYAVFDRDDPDSKRYLAACAAAKNAKLKNSRKNPVKLNCIVSVPFFELWFLLHYRDVKAFTHKNDIIKKLSEHIPDYEKSTPDMYDKTKEYLNQAISRAEALHAKNSNSVQKGTEPCTDVHILTQHLHSMASRPSQS